MSDAIDTAIAAIGLIRRVVLWQPNFLAVGNVVSRTDLISTVPSRIAAHFVQELPIVAYDPPLALPVPDVAMYWHSRSQGGRRTQVAQGENRGVAEALKLDLASFSMR
jgi:DNA-binding transcriptional LysR family regulator